MLPSRRMLPARKASLIRSASDVSSCFTCQIINTVHLIFRNDQRVHIMSTKRCDSEEGALIIISSICVLQTRPTRREVSGRLFTSHFQQPRNARGRIYCRKFKRASLTSSCPASAATLSPKHLPVSRKPSTSNKKQGNRENHSKFPRHLGSHSNLHTQSVVVNDGPRMTDIDLKVHTSIPKDGTCTLDKALPRVR